MTILWKINAGRRSAYADQFREHSIVAISWREGGDYTKCNSKDDVVAQVRSAYPDMTQRQVEVGANQIWRFLTELKLGDKVTTYDPTTRTYLLGEIVGHPEYRPDLISEIPISRKVVWLNEKSRDTLSDKAKGNLGAILTLFKVSQFATLELLDEAFGEPVTATDVLEDEIEDIDPFSGIEERALELTKDKLLGLGWEDMQDLVAALLRALGYRTIVSPVGPDRGRDIVASRDGFGFERPRILVEVKHRQSAVGAPQIRSFSAACRHSDDRGLYVSTGGFSREAHYEAERSSIVMHLMTLDGLARALTENYQQLDQRGRELLPMTKIYWPL